MRPAPPLEHAAPVRGDLGENVKPAAHIGAVVVGQTGERRDALVLVAVEDDVFVDFVGDRQHVSPIDRDDPLRARRGLQDFLSAFV